MANLHVLIQPHQARTILDWYFTVDQTDTDSIPKQLWRSIYLENGAAGLPVYGGAKYLEINLELMGVYSAHPLLPTHSGNFFSLG